MMICDYCEEPILPGDRAENRGLNLHHECFWRGIIGSLAHVEKRCGCFVRGSTEGDPEGLTRRQAAQAALKRHLELYGIENQPNTERENT